MQKLTPNKDEILIVFALSQEAKGLPEKLGFKTLYTGVGKVNAAIKLGQALSSGTYKAVLNMGTAGSQCLNKGEVVWAQSFVQHDMDVTPLGFKKGETPFEKDCPLELQSTLNMPNELSIKNGLVLTGDSFVTTKLDWQADAIDMEAYALAKTCRAYNIPFGSIKYISDSANEESVNDWPEQVKIASVKFEEILKNYFS